MPDKRNPAAENDGAPKITDEAIGSSLDDGTDFDLVNCTHRELIAFLAGTRHGIWWGTDQQMRRREAEDAAVYAMAVGIVHRMAEIPPHDELEDARLRRTFESAARWAASEEAAG